MRIILASQSPRRKELLQFITSDFEIMPSDVDESIPEGMSPDEAVKMLSQKKASHIAESEKNAIILGSDTVISFNNQIIGKAHTEDQAREILESLSGNRHEVLTGVTIIESSEDNIHQEIVKTYVNFRKISKKLLDWYIRSGEYKDKAGAYAIQGKGGLFVDSIDGCYYNIVGFPISTILKMFESMEIEFF